MGKTKISWCQDADGNEGDTWNPTMGCEVCSPGCKNCYAMAIAGRFSGPGQPFEGLVTIGKNKKAVWNGAGRINPNALLKPLTWRAGRGVFVDSMSDLFYRGFDNDIVAAVFGVMAAAPQHRYMILTKREERMLDWYRWINREGGRAGFDRRAITCWQKTELLAPHVQTSTWASDIWNRGHNIPWPLPHVWQGVSVEDKKHGLPRIEALRNTDVAVRFLSIEPLLEDLGELDLSGIQWVIIGCESGRFARDCDPAWIRNIVHQAKAQNVAVWLKQARPWDEGWNGMVAVGIGIGPGSKIKGTHGDRVVELPYLDEVQYKEFPNASTK